MHPQGYTSTIRNSFRTKEQYIQKELYYQELYNQEAVLLEEVAEVLAVRRKIRSEDNSIEA